MQDIDNWVATMPSDIGQPGWENVQSSQFNVIVKNREDQVVAAIANQISASEGDVNGGVNAFISDMTKGGWALAGGWYQRAGLLRSKLSTITSESVATSRLRPSPACRTTLARSSFEQRHYRGRDRQEEGRTGWQRYDGSVCPSPRTWPRSCPRTPIPT
jgi:hypothetical protein